MFCTYRTLLVLIALNVPSIGGAEEPTAAKSSSKADVWPTLEWKEAAPSPFARVESPAAIVDSKIYLFGGFTEDLDASNQVDVYDPVSDSWTWKKDMPTRLTHLNPAVDGNTIWFAGGFKGKHPGPVTAEVWKYDIASDTWTAGPPLPERRAGGAWRWSKANYITSAATKPIAIRMPVITGVCRSKGGKTGSAKLICPTRAAT
jgi:hypothetical protein